MQKQKKKDFQYYFPAAAICVKSTLSVCAGIMLGRMGPNGSALVNFCQSLNEAVLRIVAIVIW